MRKVKYYYDSENLAYRKIKPLKRRSFAYIALFLLASGLFGLLSFIVLLNTPYFETPKDRLLKREIENMKLQFSILNKKTEQIDNVMDNIEERDNNLYRVYFNTAAISAENRKSAFENAKKYKELEGFDNSDLVINTTKKIDILSKRLAVQSQSLDEILKLAKEKINCWLQFRRFSQ